MYIKYLNNKTTELELNQECTIYYLKLLILKEDQIPPDQMKLYFVGEELKDHNTIGYYYLPMDATIYVVKKIRGGMYQETAGSEGDYDQFESIILLMANVIGKIKI